MGGALLNGISVCVKETLRALLTLLPCEQRENREEAGPLWTQSLPAS